MCDVCADGVVLQLSHQGTLLDLWMKYALVAPTDDVVADMREVAAAADK